MTFIAGCLGNVGARQPETSGGVVVENRAAPPGSVVAHLASGWEAGGGVSGVSGSLVGAQVAALACSCRPPVLIVDMTLATLDSSVAARQWKPGRCRMIEPSAAPSRRRMANSAVLRESRRGVIRIRGRLIYLKMAKGTLGRHARVSPAIVAVGTTSANVRSC